jgi:hypothetical protein
MPVSSISLSEKVNYANILLILVSLILSFWIPFHLFLFAYAVLGPLHYLTEISWLHKNNYFVKGKYDYLILIALGLLVYHANFGIFGEAPDVLGLGTTTIFVSFVAAFCFLAFDKLYPKLIGIFVSAVLGMFVFTLSPSINEHYFIVVAVFLPTIIHVCVFTWLFMLYGSIKTNSKSGYFSCAFFIIACLILVFYRPSFDYQISNYVATLYHDTFSILNNTLMYSFGFSDVHISEPMNRKHFFDIFFSVPGQMFTRFVAFIYLYHYLNWFSKTSIIKWHEVSIEKLIIISTLWVMSVALYFYDYMLGFQVLFTLSMMHVFLEFPLNFRTIQTLVQKIGRFS